jgi:dCTP deaminase
MALADRDIFELLKSGKLKVHPILSKKQVRGARIDLRLDNIFYIIRRFEKPCYDVKDYLEKAETPKPLEKAETPKPLEKAETPKPYGYTCIIPYGTRFILHPGDYVLAPLFEFFELPANLLGRLDGRSSLGRLGILVHSTAGSIDPGFKGPVIIELMNGGVFPVALYPLMRVATLSLTYMTQEAKYLYKGKYGDLDEFPGAESRLHKDEDLKLILDMANFT